MLDARISDLKKTIATGRSSDGHSAAMVALQALLKWPFISFIFFVAAGVIVINRDVDTIDPTTWTTTVWFAFGLILTSIAYSGIACCYNQTYHPNEDDMRRNGN